MVQLISVEKICTLNAELISNIFFKLLYMNSNQCKLKQNDLEVKVNGSIKAYLYCFLFFTAFGFTRLQMVQNLMNKDVKLVKTFFYK